MVGGKRRESENESKSENASHDQKVVEDDMKEGLIDLWRAITLELKMELKVNTKVKVTVMIKQVAEGDAKEGLVCGRWFSGGQSK